jgi:hypothetical protein
MFSRAGVQFPHDNLCTSQGDHMSEMKRFLDALFLVLFNRAVPQISFNDFFPPKRFIPSYLPCPRVKGLPGFMPCVRP